MITRQSSGATFLAGTALACLVACSAKSTGEPPVFTAGSGQAGSSPSLGGAGGAAPVAGASSVAGAHAAAGSPAAAAGSGSGVAGAPVVGAAGATGGGSCKPATGAVTDLAIDDLEDGDNAIQALGSRIGYWYTYNDGSAAQIPAPDKSGAVPFKTTAGGHSALFSAETSGPAFLTWGAGMGFDFNNTASKSCAYNASAYSGIKFWAKGNVTLKAMVTTPATTLQATPIGSNSGTCTSTTMCEDHYALTPKPVLTGTWAQYTIDFASATTFAQEGWGVKATFDKSNILAVQFQVAKGEPFDFSIDDLTFY